jgi:hypothetical protein
MLGEGAHVPHHKFWLVKNLFVNALKNEVFISLGIQGYQESVVDIAVTVSLDVYDLAG